MRVAGSVIWATDLMESSTLQSGGKNQPDVETYTYSVSMAVALSSRAASGVGRIWADGKLLRGEAGDFKVRTEFRFYTGDEDQAVDPLIASIEGIGLTPSHRGLAVAVFEDLELADYGNRIPFLTFELLGDEEAPTIGGMLTDATGGVVFSDATATVEGYAAHGSSKRAAIEPLAGHFGIDLRDSDGRIESGIATLFEVGVDDLGCAPDERAEPAQERSVLPERSVPAALTLDYYDPARDFQVGRMQASAGGKGTVAESVDLPVVMGAEAARGLAEDSLARRWAQRERLNVRLPIHFLPLQCGDLIELAGSSRRWSVRQVTIEALVAVVELQPAWTAAPALLADPGRTAPNPDVVAEPTRLALLDLPDLGGGPVLQLQLAAANSTESWRRVPVEIEMGGSVSGGTSASGQAVLGTALTVLPPNQAAAFDLVSSVDVELANDQQWLESRDDDALIQGANLAVLGAEVFQFGSAVPIGPKPFRLSRLLRGRFGSEWAMAGHAIGEDFALIDARALRAVVVPDALLGSTVEVTAFGVGDGGGTDVSRVASGEALRPPSPVHLRGVISGGALDLSWVRRSRSGYAWLDEVDVPVGESVERHRVRLEGSAGSVELETIMPSVTFSSAALSVAGSGPATVCVAQVGERAISRWASLSINI